MAASVEERFWGRVDTSGECWVWTGKRLPKGYGVFTIKGKTVYAHRYSWALHNGEIPAGLHVLHRCDNPPCCNPEHLWTGTPAENIADCVAKGRIATGDKRIAHRQPEIVQGERNGGAKLTTEQVREMRARYAHGGVTYRELAAHYAVSIGAVERIIRRRRWGHLD